MSYYWEVKGHIEIWWVWKNKIEFFQAVLLSVLFHDYTTWILMPGEKARFNQHKGATYCFEKIATKQHLYGYLLFISETLQLRQTRHAGHCKPNHPMDYYTWSYQYWLIYKNIHSSQLCRHWMPSTGRWVSERIKEMFASFQQNT